MPAVFSPALFPFDCRVNLRVIGDLMEKRALIATIVGVLLAILGIVRLHTSLIEIGPNISGLFYDLLIFAAATVFAHLGKVRSQEDTSLRIVAVYTVYFAVFFLFFRIVVWWDS